MKSGSIIALGALLAGLVVVPLLSGGTGGAQIPLPEVGIAASGDVVEGSDAVFTVSTSAPVSSDLAIPVTISEGPVSGIVVASGETGSRSVTILAGATSVSLAVETVGDIADEPRGLVMAVLDAPAPGARYTVSESAGYSTVVVDDNDGPDATTEITIAGVSLFAVEGSNALFKLMAEPVPPSPVVVSVGVSQDGDFGAAGRSTVRVSKAVTYYTVTTVDDGWDEPHGSVTASVLDGAGYSVGSPSSASREVRDDDAPGQVGDPKVSISAGSAITEGGSTVFTISASPAFTTPITVNVGVSDDGDFGASGPASVTFSGASASYTVTTDDDSIDEPHGSVTANIKPGPGYDVSSPSSASVQVSDNDNPVVKILASSAPAVEGSPVAFTLLTGLPPEQALAVQVDIASSGAFGVADGTVSVTIPAGGAGTARFTVATAGDNVDEADGTVTATILADSGYTVGNPGLATATVKDDDSPVIDISADGFVIEGGSATFTVTADPTPHQSLPVTVDISASGQFGVNTGTRTVMIATSGTAELSVATTPDSNHEADGSITATVRSGSGYTVGSASVASVEVADDDGPDVTVSTSGDVTEGGTALFTITPNGRSLAPLTVNVLVTASGQFGVSPVGQRTVSIPIGHFGTVYYHTHDDRIDESDGSVTLTVLAGRGYVLGNPASATIHIADDDTLPSAAPVITISGGGDITEGQKASFTVTASPAPVTPITVNLDYDITGGRHQYSGFDLPASLRISSATTVIKSTIGDDNRDDHDSVLTATVEPGAGYTVGDPSQASVGIADNDVPTVEISRASAHASINEDGTATFSLRMIPTPHRNKDVTVTVNVAATGDFGVQTGPRQVTLSGSGGSFTISPVPDNVNEANGTITVTLVPSPDYAIHQQKNTASIAVTDDDLPAGARVSITAATIKTTPGTPLVFNISLSEPASNRVTLDYSLGRLTRAGKLMPGYDFWVDSTNRFDTTGTIEFAPGETQKTIRVEIAQNAWFDNNDRVTVTLSNLTGDASLETRWASGRVVTTMN